MRKLIVVALAVVVTAAVGLAQEQSVTQPGQDMAKLAVAPKQMNGIGRMVVNITDTDGVPVNGAYAHLDSARTDGFLCESWASTNATGFAALPPIHMGKLKLKVKAKGYREQVVEVPYEELSSPIVVKLKKK
ncbi:MAG: carboxypeptidase-like regulatory domain-containing protein [Pyrinomonadaceae bacterium]